MAKILILASLVLLGLLASVEAGKWHCPWTWVNPETGNCYFIPEGEYSVSEGRKVCESLGAHLADIRSLKENTVATNYASSQNIYRIWIGIHNVNKNEDPADWRYWNNDQDATYFRWAPGEPNNLGGDEHCVEIYTGGLYKTYCSVKYSHWNDSICWIKRRILCEKKGYLESEASGKDEDDYKPPYNGKGLLGF